MPAVPRFAAYGLVSTALAGAVMGGALKTRPNFYAAAVSVGRSGGSLMVLSNFCLFVAIAFGLSFKRVFFGDLRPVEYEHMFERLWIFLTESLIALATFRDDFNVGFIALFGMLVFLKCFHWISADRVDYIDQVPPPGPPVSFHIRLVSVLTLLTIFDILLFTYAIQSIMVKGVSGMVLFASEFAILNAAIGGTWARYAVGVIDLYRARGRIDAPAWEEKSMYLFYIELAVDFTKLLTYLVFFMAIFFNYGLPFHILRDVYMTLRSFLARGADLVRYRRATHNMDELYPDATEAELNRLGDHTCIICREEMVAREVAQPNPEGPNETPKRLACGHVFHFHCLRSWLERQQICPTCRRDVLAPSRGSRAPPAAPAPAPRARPANADVQADELPRETGVPGSPGAASPGPAQPPREARAARGAADDERDRMRSAFEEYFRLPAHNGDAPIPLAAPRTNMPRAASAPPTGEETDEHRLQRGIWGAPIVPGRFQPPPLGAAPTWTPAGPSRRTTGETSGNVTPAASQAPPVFSSTGTSRRRPEMATSDTAGANGTHEEVESKGTDEAATTDDNMTLREAAAAAALRRLGTPTAADKGKAPVHTPARGTPSTAFDAPATHRAFLTAPATPYARAETGTPRTPEAARVVLDERLRALRDVDYVVWSLVGELSRLKSAWETEDDAAPAASGSGGDPAAVRSDDMPTPMTGETHDP